MIGFETDLEDLRTSSGSLAGAADAAQVALSSVRGVDVPTGPILPGIFGTETATVDNVFGTTLGMPHVANAYSAHLAAIEKLLAKLHESTVDTSHALLRVAELYEQADENAKQRTRAAAAGLDEN